jgi:hypothetical protein
LDALIRGRQTIYEANHGAAVLVMPIVGDDVQGLQLSLQF